MNMEKKDQLSKRARTGLAPLSMWRGAGGEADQIDENQLFSEGETVTPVEKVTDDKVQESTDKESVRYRAQSTAVMLTR
jgi:hypothetical protein